MFHCCLHCGLSFRSARALGSHRRTHNKTETRCDQCGQIFESSQACAVHRSSHQHIIYYPPPPPPIPQQRFQCTECSNVYSTFEERLNHMANRHQ